MSISRVTANDVASMAVDGSLYDVLERVGHAVANGIVTIEPTVSDRALARLLKVKAGVPILFLRQIDFDQAGAAHIDYATGLDGNRPRPGLVDRTVSGWIEGLLRIDLESP